MNKIYLRMELNNRYKEKDKSEINYGSLSKNLINENDLIEKFYLTTAINYTNGYPHLGHAYEAICADVLARYYRLFGKNVYFLTGSDEHGQKIANKAEVEGVEPIENCNKYSESFRALNQRLLISNDGYIRTTSEEHKITARKIWEKCAENGDIYLDNYEGWYNEREETFVSKREAELMDFKDQYGTPLKKTLEECYFFRMSKYLEQIKDFIRNNPDFIQPLEYSNMIMERLEKDGLNDISISRTSFKWGISLPVGFKDNHVMYVWFDALTNYLSGIKYFDKEEKKLKTFWPANIHIIGKDILWFHSIIWSCMLLSANIPLPKSILVHGFINTENGTKMSKSLGNAIDPHNILDMFPVDSFRYYVTSEISYGSDLNFSTNTLLAKHNNELADILGNLVNRIVNLTKKYADEKVPNLGEEWYINERLPFDFNSHVIKIKDLIERKIIHFTIIESMNIIRDLNRYLSEKEPWKIKGNDETNSNKRKVIVRMSLEGLYLATHFIAPFLPLTADKIFDKLNTPPKIIDELNNFNNLVVNTEIKIGNILFEKIK